MVLFLISNEAIKHTNWYRNNFVYIKQMCSNEGYRNYLIRNLDIVNVGSNPARFAFHYDDVLGENWSTGGQGFDMDFEILKFRHSFIKKGGVVLIPLVAFSSVSGCLRKYKPQYLGNKYYAKFIKTLDWSQIRDYPERLNAVNWMRFPLKYEPKAIRYLLRDVAPDNRLAIIENPMMKPQMVEHAREFIEGWMREFDIKSLKEPLSPMLIEGMEISTKIVQEMIDFLIERELIPVIVLPPMSEPLQRYFTQDIKRLYIYDFVDRINRPQVKFLDYSEQTELQNPDLYFNSIFMNLRGRKIFTKQVLADLNLT